MANLQRLYHPHVRPETLRTHRPALIAGTALALASAPLLAYAYKSYQAWLALGRGGVPYNLFGWLVQSTLHIIARRDTRTPAPYRPADLEPVYGAAGQTTFLAGATISQREGERPGVPTTVVPQRQTTQRASPAAVEAQNAFLAALAAANPDVLEIRTSRLEGPPHPSLYVRGEVPKAQGFNGDEIAHVHHEGSTHVSLSLVDAAALIEAGWAERHKMSGTIMGVPWGYVMVYAPRDEAEFAFWREVVCACARFVLHGRGVGLVVPE
ncbi:hypothetical protein F4779DRAFT_463917 [Xylariaceae sp. FL0662B]|nr:hypothetical protein F4779DRAFT_463917 [Xylariaceae sp. FL0662B]